MLQPSDAENEFLGALYELFLVARDLAAHVASIPEVPPEQISKYAWYLVSLRSGGGPKVVRCLERGWGPAQHKSVVSAAADSITGKGGFEAAAVVSNYGVAGNSEIEVTVYARGYALKATFPFEGSGDGIAYSQTDEQAKDAVLRLLAAWRANTGGKTPRKKFLALLAVAPNPSIERRSQRPLRAFGSCRLARVASPAWQVRCE